MGFRVTGPSQFVLGVSIRALALGGLTILFVQLVTHTQLYATSLVVVGVAAVIIADLARCITRADRRVENFIESLKAGGAEVPPKKWSEPDGASAPFDEAVMRVQSALT